MSNDVVFVGELAKDGPRHDNDFAEIAKISIIPTQQEVLSEKLPFIPSCVPDAPHFLPKGGQRLLDSQFRLLREDMLHPIRAGIQNFLAELQQVHHGKKKRPWEQNGRFKGGENGMSNSDLNIYFNLRIEGVKVDKRGFYCRLSFKPPKLRSAKSSKDRKSYWEKSKRLMTGSLIGVLLPKPDSLLIKQFDLYFG